MRYCLGLLLSVLWLLTHGATAQVRPATSVGLDTSKAITQYVCDTWQKDKGLPQNSVFAITQSRVGYLWIATYEGLARFDGMQFNNFSPVNVPQLLTSGIWDVFEDSAGRLWIGTNNGGLVCYYKGVFRTFTTTQGLPSNLITRIAESRDKRLWIGTRQGLAEWTGDSTPPRIYTTLNGLAGKEITALHAGRSGILWVGTSRGLSAYQQGKFEDYSRSKIIFINKNITSIAEDYAGNVWIGTQAGLVRWNMRTASYQTFRTEDGLSDDYITKIFVDNQGTLWLGTQSSGLMRVLPAQVPSEKPVFERFTVREGLRSNSINEIYQDIEGSLWLGLNRGGLCRLRDGKFTNYTVLEGLADDVSNCVFEDRQGALWIGTLSGGVSKLDKGKFTNYTTAQGLSSNYIRSIAQDASGDMWLASYGGGLMYLQVSRDALRPPVKVFTNKDGLASNICRAVVVDERGAVWIGTKNGLSKFEQGKFTNYTRQQGLVDNSITTLLVDKQGNIWAGTEGAGLSCLRRDGSIQNYTTKNGLNNLLIFALYEDAKGAIWLGEKGGISRFYEGKWQHLSPKEGLVYDAIHSITEDAQGRMWFSSNNGIFWGQRTAIEAVMNGKAARFEATLYQEEDGMKSADCATLALPTVVRDRKGRLWYPTTLGISYIDPANIKRNEQVSPVVIKRIVADNQEYNVFDKIYFKAGTSKFEIDFASLSFLAPNKIRYRYRLEGDNYHEEWNETTNREDAFYTNLPPGNYVFRIQATNSDGVWNERGAEISFYLAPYFYQTWWFYALCVVLVASFAIGIYTYRVNALERSRQQLQQGIEESTQRIRMQMREINRQAEELKTIDNIVKTINQEHKFEDVLQALLDQGLILFPQSERGLFLLYDAPKKLFQLVATVGYDMQEFGEITFAPELVHQYCRQGLEVGNDVYELRPAAYTLLLATHYRPQSSVAMYIRHGDNIAGVLFFDNTGSRQEVSQAELPKISRFREHAVSAFTKAQILREIAEKNMQIENSYRKISDSIRYARRIQAAILPDVKRISEYFAEIFIFNEPRDIVSGDFYWFAEGLTQVIATQEQRARGEVNVFQGFGDPKIALAAVDCTGHGVPGAFMTVVGNDLLNTIVLEDKILKPDLILSQLDMRVRQYLKQEEGSQSKDGMDIALMVIDEMNMSIEYAGAKNPLYRISAGEFIEYSASKFPIGGAQIARKTFHTHSIPYQSGDVFYLFSDGFHDQFGGEQDRKFGSKHFRELLLSVHHLPLAEQQELLTKIFREWRGNRQQTDDVLLIGIKLQ